MDQQTNRHRQERDFTDRVGELPRLSLSDRRKVLVEWNQTRKAYPRDNCFHQLFEAQVERSPHAIAVESAGKRLTYEQISVRANLLAHHLQELGIGPDLLVGICLNPSLDLVVALLAILKAGGAYVPLDPAHPKERLDYMIADSGMKVLITRHDFSPTLARQNLPTVRVDEPLADSDSGRRNPTSAVQAENLAYVIYTSGSTGRPKGVMVPHRGLVNYLCWATEAYAVGNGAGALVHSSIAFDLTITGLFAPLLIGRCVYLLPPEQTLEDLATALHGGVDFSLVKITPAHLAMLCLQLEKGPAATKSFIIGGEALFGESLVSWRECAPNALLVNEYGPTETVVGCCAYFVPKDRRFAGSVPIGRPIANTQLYVLDAQKQPVPVGATGELYVAGDGLARGYLNQPALTLEKFVENPFVAEDEHASLKMYRTGDLVRYQPDGNLEFLGRVDDQIKLRGYRIEPAEIEAALVSHSLVRNAAVMVHADVAGDEHLAAYVVLANGESATAAELRTHLTTKLPDYMIPTSFTALPEFPLTPNGKINRRGLPRPDVLSIAAVEYVAPETETERRLVEIWGEALQRRIGLHDNFFELGGHSLLAVRLVARLNQTFEVNLDALTLYQRPTVHELAGLLDGEEPQSRGARFIRVREGDGGPAVIFLNPPLEFVRLANRMRGKGAFYISEVPIAQSALEAALQFDAHAFPTLPEMVAPHASLIRESGLSGPFFLAGYSSYGTVAFEVAHLLQDAGKPAAGVFLFDADMKAPRLEALKVLSRRHARNVRDQGLVYLWEKVRGRLARVRLRRVAMTTSEPMAPDASLSNSDVSWRIFQRIWDYALRHYRPQPLAARGVLFRAEISIYGDVHDYDGCLGWKNLFTDGLTIIEVPGDHVSMWNEPDVSALRQSWERALGKFSRSTNALLCSAPTVLAAVVCSI